MSNGETVSLSFPFHEDAVRALRAGDRVRLFGTVFTGRDRLHKRLGEGGAPPTDLRNGALFHCGPVVLRDPNAPGGAGWRIVAAGPTTSLREEPYMADILRRHGVRLVIGKGGMGPKTLAALRECGAVYLQAVGGAAALTARRIAAVEDVFLLDEFGPTEAMWRLRLDGLEAIVGMDSHGASLFDGVRTSSRAALDRLLQSDSPASLPSPARPLP